MCRTGGPRCTKHAREGLNKAMGNLRKLTAEYEAADPAGRSRLLPKVKAATDRAVAAQQLYDTTTGGLSDLARELDGTTGEEREVVAARFRDGYAKRLAQLQAHDVAAGNPPRESLGLVVDGVEWGSDGYPVAGQDLAESDAWLIDPDVAQQPPEWGTSGHRAYSHQFASLVADEVSGEICDTGGGCKAIHVPLPGGYDVLVTNGDTALPDGDGNLLVSLYDPDGNEDQTSLDHAARDSNSNVGEPYNAGKPMSARNVIAFVNGHASLIRRRHPAVRDASRRERRATFQQQRVAQIVDPLQVPKTRDEAWVYADRLVNEHGAGWETEDREQLWGAIVAKANPDWVVGLSERHRLLRTP